MFFDNLQNRSFFRNFNKRFVTQHLIIRKWNIQFHQEKSLKKLQGGLEQQLNSVPIKNNYLIYFSCISFIMAFSFKVDYLCQPLAISTMVFICYTSYYYVFASWLRSYDNKYADYNSYILCRVSITGLLVCEAYMFILYALCCLTGPGVPSKKWVFLWTVLDSIFFDFCLFFSHITNI